MNTTIVIEHEDMDHQAWISYYGRWLTLEFPAAYETLGKPVDNCAVRHVLSVEDASCLAHLLDAFLHGHLELDDYRE